MRKVIWLFLLGASMAAQNAPAPTEVSLRVALEEAERNNPTGERLAPLRNNLGVVLRDEGKFAEAERLLRRAVDLCRTTYGPRHRNTTIALGGLAGVLTSETRLAEADQLLREAISIAATAMEEGDNEAIILYSQRANLFLF